MIEFFSLIRVLFTAELFTGALLFLPYLKKRKNFWWRLCLAFLCITVVAIFLPNADNVVLTAIYSYFSILMLFVVALIVCFEEHWQNIIYIAVASYTVEKINSVVNSLLSLADSKLFYHLDKWNTWWFLLWIAGSVLVYFLFWLLCVRRIKKYGSGMLKIKNLRLLALACVAVLTNTVMSWMSTQYVSVNIFTQLFDFLWNLLACILLLVLEFFMIDRGNAEHQFAVMQELFYQQGKQYRVSKENIAAINQKCHDIKYILQASRECPSNGAIYDVIQKVDIYDATIKTGNEVLDLILTEKSLRCKEENIAITCFADGTLLSFFDDVDLYIMFGNLLDNAMRALCKIEDRTRRNIYLTVKKVNEFASICVENEYAGEVKMEDGLPVTTKSDKNNHGFGMRSIKMIVEKYEGGMNISARDGVFKVDILVPVPASPGTK